MIYIPTHAIYNKEGRVRKRREEKQRWPHTRLMEDVEKQEKLYV
jgi:hypothetical protein